MLRRFCTAILAIAAGISTLSVAQAAQVANGLTVNGLTVNGLSANGTDVQGRLNDASSSSTRLEAVILQDGSVFLLK
ncbi:hypothetical protein [Microvirga sp. KLBC 81]|uniref:hypothetical protein n=1 Tax=Microvirga sp. KLBC 81 TaxID=1862707 RepID=UPI001402510A|nr:hypothetical protein [Microvirga sp. KLBC 81]